jgi:hypothetical protein
MRIATVRLVSFKPPRQLSMALDSAKLRGISPIERRGAVLRLASLLMEAAGVEVKERRDDGR